MPSTGFAIASARPAKAAGTAARFIQPASLSAATITLVANGVRPEARSSTASRTAPIAWSAIRAATSMPIALLRLPKLSVGERRRASGAPDRPCCARR
jgi:hypothetical protein